MCLYLYSTCVDKRFFVRLLNVQITHLLIRQYMIRKEISGYAIWDTMILKTREKESKIDCRITWKTSHCLPSIRCAIKWLNSITHRDLGWNNNHSERLFYWLWHGIFSAISFFSIILWLVQFKFWILYGNFWVC